MTAWVGASCMSVKWSVIGLCAENVHNIAISQNAGAGNLLNAILDPILIFVFGLGVGGAAIATVISEYVYHHCRNSVKAMYFQYFDALLQ